MSSNLSFNIGILKEPRGFLKLFVTLIGVVNANLCISTMFPSPVINFAAGVTFMTGFPFLVTTFLLLISILSSPMTADVISKTIFELMFHFFGCAFYLISGLAMLVLALKHLEGQIAFEKAVTISVLGLINCSFFFFSSHYSYKSYRAS